MLEKIKQTAISVIKAPLASGLKAGWYIICVGIAIMITLYAMAFVKYHILTAWKVLGLQMKIRAGTVCFVSKVGHNGFWYPIYDETGMTEVVEDIENAKIKSWVCGRGELVAVEAPALKIKNLYGNPESITVVWIDRKNLPPNGDK